MIDPRWTVLRSRYLWRDRWLSLRADDCVTARGVTVAPYYIVEMPDFVHVLATDADERVVLVRQYRHGVRDMSIELPGGIVDASDADVPAAGVRELREETGFSGGVLAPLVVLSADPGRYPNRTHFLAARGVVPGAAAPAANEDIEVLLVSRDEALRLALSGGIVHAAHAAAIVIGLGAGS